jgi:hypothetical protein
VRIYTAPALVADLNRQTRASLSRSPDPAFPLTANPKATAILKAKQGIKTALRYIPDGDCSKGTD